MLPFFLCIYLFPFSTFQEKHNADLPHIASVEEDDVGLALDDLAKEIENDSNQINHVSSMSPVCLNIF